MRPITTRVKGGALPPAAGEFFKIQRDVHVELALVNRAPAEVAAVGISESFADVLGKKIRAVVVELVACAAPVAGEVGLLPDVLRRGRRGGWGGIGAREESACGEAKHDAKEADEVDGPVH